MGKSVFFHSRIDISGCQYCGSKGVAKKRRWKQSKVCIDKTVFSSMAVKTIRCRNHGEWQNFGEWREKNSVIQIEKCWSRINSNLVAMSKDCWRWKINGKERYQNEAKRKWIKMFLRKMKENGKRTKKNQI